MWCGPFSHKKQPVNWNRLVDGFVWEKLSNWKQLTQCTLTLEILNQSTVLTVKRHVENSVAIQLNQESRDAEMNELGCKFELFEADW